MKKSYLLCSLVISSMLLSACSISTPAGTLDVSFDDSKKTDSTVITDSDGNTTIIHTEDAKSYVDQLLSSVTLPEDASSEELINFVYSNLDSLGIDLNNLDLSDSSKIAEVEQALENALEEKGVDTSEISINLEDFVEEGSQNE